MPIIRYRTRDLTRFLPGECECGRTHRRIDRIAGRADDMMILKGVNIYPMQIEQCLMAMPEVGQNYPHRTHPRGRVRPDARQGGNQGRISSWRTCAPCKDCRSASPRTSAPRSWSPPRVELCQSDSIPKAEGKAVRVVDLRDKE